MLIYDLREYSDDNPIIVKNNILMSIYETKYSEKITNIFNFDDSSECELDIVLVLVGVNISPPSSVNI